MIRQKLSETTLIIHPHLLQRLYCGRLSVILYPLPFVSADDELAEVQRVGEHGEKVRVYFNNYQLWYDLPIGTMIGFKEDYFDLLGKTYYLLDMANPEELENEIHWRPANTMQKKKIRGWYPVKKVNAIRTKYLRRAGKACGPLHLYPEIKNHDWTLLIFLENT